MAGGLFGRAFVFNEKCIVFSILCMMLFLYKPVFKNNYMLYFTLFIIFVVAYVAASRYDYYFNCDLDSLLQGKYSIAGMFKKTTIENLGFKNTNSSVIIYIISLLDNQERIKNTSDNLLNKHNGYPTFIFPAIRGRDLTDEDKRHFIEKGYFEPDYFNKWNGGQQGCALSHLSLLQHISDEGNPDKHYIIIEDDGYIDNQFEELISNVIKKSNNIDWDQITLHNYKEIGTYPNEFHNKTDFLNKCSQCVGTAGYMVTKDRAKNILDRILPLQYPIDEDIRFKVDKQYGLEDPVIHIGEKIKSSIN